MNQELEIQDLDLDYVRRGLLYVLFYVSVNLLVCPSHLRINFKEKLYHLLAFDQLGIQEEILNFLNYLWIIIISNDVHFDNPENVFKVLLTLRRVFNDRIDVADEVILVVPSFRVSIGLLENTLNFLQSVNTVADWQLLIEIVYFSLLFNQLLNRVFYIDPKLVWLHPANRFDKAVVLWLISLVKQLVDQSIQKWLYIVPASETEPPLLINLQFCHLFLQLAVDVEILGALAMSNQLTIVPNMLSFLEFLHPQSLFLELCDEFVDLEDDCC